jgi:alpha-L-fucosidase
MNQLLTKNKRYKLLTLALGMTLGTSLSNVLVAESPDTSKLSDKTASGKKQVAAKTKHGKAPAGRPGESAEARDARMKWWREARFGMFIHWGPSTVLDGTYKGEKVTGFSEWIMANAKIPIAEYKEYAKQFNPVKYDPEFWVQVAKNAGMKYMVITAKHHDGFAMFDSAVTDWDVVDATAYGKDLLKPLVEACRQQDVKIGFYYSQSQDWCNGGESRLKKWDPAQKNISNDEYLKTIAVPQVRELLTGYGDLDVLWWDTPGKMVAERAELFNFVPELQPSIIENNRLQRGKVKGDFGTPENEIPDSPLGFDWETCMTLNRSWGYKSYDTKWKTSDILIKNLVGIVSMGGNYLLNIGPTAEGEIPPACLKILDEVGAWMKVNGEAIYGTTTSPFEAPEWGRYIRKGNTLYACVSAWPADGTLAVSSKGFSFTKATLLADPDAAIKLEAKGETLTLTGLPEQAPDEIVTVIRLD